MKFIFEQIRTGGDRNFAYLLGEREAGVAAIVDPSYDPKAVVQRATEQHLSVEYIINTHGHPDHTNGNSKARKLTGAKVVAARASHVGADVSVDDGDSLSLGALSLRFYHVPGHCDDHLVVHLPEQRIALTGDLIFVGKIGGTGTDEAARTERESLLRVLRELTPDTTLWPGHDYGCRPATTVALELETNPFLMRLDDVDEFLALKRDWPTFKKEHGLR